MTVLPRRASLLVFLVLVSAITIFGAAMAVFAQVREAQFVDVRKMGWRDSVAGLVFGFERQFANFRGDLAAAVVAPAAPSAAPLMLRYEILVSRIDLLSTSSSLDMLRGVPEYSELMGKLNPFVRTADALLRQDHPPRAELVNLLAQMDAMAPDVQGYTRAATSATARLVEDQFAAMRQQALVIGGLAAVQLLLVLVAAGAIWYHERQQAAARRELERLADELRAAKSAADAANRTKSHFLANMSHELRTPFQGVLGMLQLLDQSGTTAAQKDLTRTARESAQHLLTLLNDVLDLSAIEAGRVMLTPGPMDLHRLCHEACGLMRAQAVTRGLRLEAIIDPRVPRWVSGDATRIRQILFNLLSNAIKFTPAGDVTLHAAWKGDSELGARLVLSVTDTGIGMDQATQERLFRRFEMGDDTLSRRFGGAGLGLEISRTLARMMDGDLTMRSELGKGSRFELTVTLAACEPLGEQDATAAAQPAGASRVLNVLVADDHPVNRKYLGLVLENLGHNAVLCENGQEALELVRTAPFDVVLMDLHMPVLDGLAATTAIRALGGRYERLPVLALTADVMGTTRDRAQLAGMSGFLSKPVQIDELSDALYNAVAPAAALAGTGSADAAGSAAAGAAAANPEFAMSRPAELSSRFGELASHLPPGQLPNLLDMFFEDESHTIADLEDAMAGDDADQVARAAHKLIGSARMLGFRQIATVGQEIQDACGRENRGRPTAAERERLRAAIRQTRLAASRRLQA